MPLTLTSSASPFGLDAARLFAQWRAAGALLFELPLMRALAPAALVRCVSEGGSSAFWRVRHGVAEPAGIIAGGERATPALLLARAAALERTIALPQLAPADMEHAVQLEVQASTPFAPEHTIYGFLPETQAAGEEGQRVHLAITSRQQCEAALSRAALGAEAEIWLAPVAGAPKPWRPLVLRGWGEGARQRAVRRAQWQMLALLALAALLAVALLVTPTAFARLKAQQAQQAQSDLQRRAAPQMDVRESLGRDVQALQNVVAIAGERVQLAPVLDMLTEALPDGAWLNNLNVNERQFRIMGMADDAAALVQRLNAQPGVQEARLASPATRNGSEQKERFVIEFHVSAEQFGLLQPADTGAAAAAEKP